MLTRRDALKGSVATVALAGGLAGAGCDDVDTTPQILVDLDAPRAPISDKVYGSNEIGTLDGGPQSGQLDRLAGVTARRLGGNLMTTYNWTNNFANAGEDWEHTSGLILPDLLGIPKAERGEPARVITWFHETSREFGAESLVTLPLAGFVAADGDGPVRASERAPSPRWTPVVWAPPGRGAGRPGAAEIGRLVRLLVDRFGGARAPDGIRAYALDNEPSLWPETHPRIHTTKPTCRTVIERALTAAAIVKQLDPDAEVTGPVSFGITAMDNFHDAPDWPSYMSYGSFLAAYLDAFRRESERAGRRLLDVLDVHWYPESDLGRLLGTEDPALAPAVLAAPRSLWDPWFQEASWVGRKYFGTPDGNRIGVPLVPHLAAIIERHFPGTQIAITEYNFGGAGAIASGLALADALGAFGRSGVDRAYHWGALDDMLAAAFALYRNYDDLGSTFGSVTVPATSSLPDQVTAHAALSDDAAPRLHVIAINKSAAVQELRLAINGEAPWRTRAEYGFDAQVPLMLEVAAPRPVDPARETVRLPPQSARHLVLS